MYKLEESHHIAKYKIETSQTKITNSLKIVPPTIM